MKTTKRSLLKSVLALLLCFCMLLGTTFAWFTDLVTSNANKIQAGFLKIDLELLNEKTGKWKSLKNNSDPIFDYDRWEPGYTDVKILKVENEGTLALKWIAKFVSEDQLSILADVIDVYVCPSDTEIGYPADRSLEGYTKVGNLKKFINTIEKTTYGTLEAEECSYLGIALKMQESAGNEYQGLSLGGAFDIRIYATQWNGEDESDSFDNQYDKDATYPPMLETLKTYADITYKVDENNRLTEEVRLYDRSNGVLATLPVGTLIEDGATQVVLQIDGDEVDPKLVLDLRVGYDVNVEGVDPTNDKPIVILLPKVLTSNQLGVELYHEGNAMTRVYTPEALLEKQGDNDTYGDKYIYDDATGDVTVSVTHKQGENK